MVKKCDITGTGVMSGNNVSHANNHSRRRFMPNLQVVSLFSEALNKFFKLRICSKTLRSIEHNGGLDSYLESTSSNKLTDEALKIKKRLSRKKARLKNRQLPLKSNTGPHCQKGCQSCRVVWKNILLLTPSGSGRCFFVLVECCKEERQCFWSG